MRARRLHLKRYEILKRIAAECDGQVTGEYPQFFGPRENQLAGSVVGVGALLLDEIILVSPVKKRKRKERRRLTHALNVETGERASIFLAHALAQWTNTYPYYAAKMGYGEGPVEPPPLEPQLEVMLQDHFPLGQQDRKLLDRVRKHYAFLDYEPGKGFQAKEGPDPELEPTSGYIMCLRNPDWWEEADAEQRESYVNSHFLVAGNFYRSTATARAIEMVLGPAFWDSKYAAHYLTLMSPFDRDMSFEWLQGVLLGWVWGEAVADYFDLLSRYELMTNSPDEPKRPNQEVPPGVDP